MSTLLGVLLCVGCEVAVAAAAPMSDQVDVELVLAVDVSRSMDPGEFALQRAGYVAALRHPDFLGAVRGGMNGRIALTYFEWAGTVRAETLVPWQVIDSAEAAESFASQLESLPADTYRGTSISGALTFGASLLKDSGYEGFRQVIDVSGDGPNNIGEPVVPVRDAAVAGGITVNGLPIIIRPSPTFQDLDRYYADCVTGGPGSFVLPIRDSAEFATAVRRKLILEVSGLQPAEVIPVQARQPVDCGVGERDRRFYSDPYLPELGR
jgi:hypothetical protein